MKALLQSLFGDALARILSGAGLSVISYAAITPVVLGALNLVATRINGLAADVASLALMSGTGEAMTIVGSAIMARMAINAAGVGVGKAVAK
ncbi:MULTISPECIES: DUF2523 family protein [Xanthomonas translucens group]|uniref:DUF2523 family protein n=1 Tax=Xanthomonas translucens group TaxID=3390202 RepID=UPI0005793DCE|nr:DUF2523 family protein [Xanthomonas translucens]AVY66703.1 hypothetical protein NZ30_10360 [Xanthomonas translucens pv. undulosa]UKE45605.1 DUF2523 domain-containing protein [Xanthomonas translucens pv. cerealis]